MRLLRSIFFTSFLTVAITGGAHAQALKIREMTVVFDRYANFKSQIIVRGDGIDLIGAYRPQVAPVYCDPYCFEGLQFYFGSALSGQDFTGFNGTINGKYYPNVYFLYPLFYSSAEEVFIPRGRNKTVRMSAPIKLTADIGLWKSIDDVGIRDRALFYQDDVRLTGMGRAEFKMGLNPNGRRLFYDRYLSLTLSAVD